MLKFINDRRAIRVLLTLSLWVGLLGMAGAVLGAKDGTITSLAASDAPAFNQTITIKASFQADSKISNSNVYYELVAPDGVTVVATHSTGMPSMDNGDTFSDSWTTTNTSFPASGTYTLKACWSSGNSQGCQITSATTTFFSVPTLGGWLTALVVVLLGWFLWRRRRDFSRAAVNPAQPSTNATP